MTDEPQKWRSIDKRVTGYITILEEGERYMLVARHHEDGSVWSRDRVRMSRKTGGPAGYVKDGTSIARGPAAPLRHKWTQPLRVDGEFFGNRCVRCKIERKELGAGGRYSYRAPGGVWAPGSAPTCEGKL